MKQSHVFFMFLILLGLSCSGRAQTKSGDSIASEMKVSDTKAGENGMVEDPVFDPVSGSTIYKGKTVRIECATPTAIIMYGIGKEVEAGTLYTGPIKITQDTTYITAIAIDQLSQSSSHAVNAVYYGVPDPDYVDPVYGEIPLPLTLEYFFDWGVLDYVRRFDTDGNDTLSGAERARVSEIEPEYSLSNLDAIAYFPELVKFSCWSFYGDHVDFSHNPKLEHLYLHYASNLENLDLSHNSELGYLNIRRALILENLDLSQNKKLTDLQCTDNPKLKTLNIGENTALLELNCNGNPFLSHIDVSKISNLQTLNCQNTRIRELDLRNCTELRYLDCSQTNLQALDLSENINLNTLHCSGTALTHLDLSAQQDLYSFECENSYREVPKNANRTFDLKTLSGFNPARSLHWEGGRVDADGMLTFNEDYVKYDYITNYSGYNKEYFDTVSFTLAFPIEGIAIDETHFPDENFRAYMQWFDMDDNSILSGAELGRINDIDVSEKDISDLAGVEYLTNLKRLYCWGNGFHRLDLRHNTQLENLQIGSLYALDSLDLSHNSKLKNVRIEYTPILYLNLDGAESLENLRCYYVNRLKRLDVSKNKKLQELSCYLMDSLQDLMVRGAEALRQLECNRTEIHALDISENTELYYLDCSYTPLTVLDVRQNPNLWQLNCVGTHLTELDVRANLELRELYCSQTDIESLDVSQNEALYTLQCSGNQLTGLDLSQNKKLSENFECIGNYREVVRNADQKVDLKTLPGFDLSRASNFRGGRVDANGILTFSENTVTYNYNTLSPNEEKQSVTFTLAFPMEEIPIDEKHFPDERFRSYITKRLDHNKNGSLSSGERMRVYEINAYSYEGYSFADIQGLEYFTNLFTLRCEGGNFSTLDLHQNSHLEELLLSSIWALDSLDVSGNANLKSLSVRYTNVQRLELSGNKRLEKIDCYHNDDLDELIVRGLPFLKELRCEETNIERLNLRGCRSLESLYCFNNLNLRSLQMGESSDLRELFCYNTKISELDLSGNANLQILHCNNTNIKSLDLSHATRLKKLQCSGTALSSLDLRHNPDLYQLECVNSNTEVRLSPTNTFYLGTLPGFDSSYASEWTGCTFDEETNMLTFIDSVVTYQYVTNYVGEYSDIPEKLTFRLMVSNHKVEETDPDYVMVPSPVFHPDGGSVLEPGTGVKITCTDERAEIYYTMGSDMTSLVYKDSIIVTENPTHISAVAYVPGVGTSRPSVAIYYVIPGGADSVGEIVDFIPTPVFSLESGASVQIGDTIGITCEYEEAEIYYSTERRGTAFRRYTAPIEITEQTTYIRAYAALAGIGISNEASAVYYVTEPETVPITAEYFPDTYFRDYVSSHFDIINPNDSLEKEEREYVERIFIAGRPDARLPLEDLTGIRYFPNLKEIDCQYTELSFLNLGKVGALTHLNCDHNYLTSLDLSLNPKLERVSCMDSRFDLGVLAGETFDLRNLMGFDISRPFEWNGGWQKGYNLVVDDTIVVYRYTSGYQGSSPDVPADFGFVLSANEDNREFIPIDEYNFPDDYFRSYVAEWFDWDGDTLLSREERDCVGRISLFGNSETTRKPLKNLTGMRFFPNLIELWCDYTQIESLELGQNRRLETVHCSHNALTSLDLSRNAVLKTVKCQASVYSVTMERGAAFDLSRLPGGFDISRAEDWEGGHIEGNMLYFDDRVVRYRYKTLYEGYNEDVPEYIDVMLVCLYVDVEGVQTVTSVFSAYVHHGVLHVDNANGLVEVFNVKGQKVASGMQTEYTLPCQGIYIVRNQGYSLKVANF